MLEKFSNCIEGYKFKINFQLLNLWVSTVFIVKIVHILTVGILPYFTNKYIPSTVNVVNIYLLYLCIDSKGISILLYTLYNEISTHPRALPYGIRLRWMINEWPFKM